MRGACSGRWSLKGRDLGVLQINFIRKDKKTT